MQKARDSSKVSAGGSDPREIMRERTLLIADVDPVHRAFLLRIVVEMGFETRKVIMAKDAAEALQIVRDEGISTILFDDSLGMRTLEGIQEILSKNTPESAFVFLVSQNSSQAGVGRVVETDVDGFCLKPFSTGEFKEEFVQALTEKLVPTEFRKILNLGKSRLFEGDLEQAEKLFEKAKELGPTPSTAHFYLGQVKMMKDLLEESRQEFMQGILLNQIHCKCLKAMFDLLYRQQKMDESYEVLRRLVGVFPENIERLKLAIRMSVSTGNFFDLETWYEVYNGQEEKPDDVKMHICSALAVLGRYLLMTEKIDEAVRAFEQSLSVGIKKEIFLTYAVESLQKYGLGEEATRLVKEHDPEFAEALAASESSPSLSAA